MTKRLIDNDDVDQMDIDDSSEQKKYKQSPTCHDGQWYQYDFSIIDKKIEEIQVIMDELIALKESLRKYNESIPTPINFCSYLV